MLLFLGLLAFGIPLVAFLISIKKSKVSYNNRLHEIQKRLANKEGASLGQMDELGKTPQDDLRRSPKYLYVALLVVVISSSILGIIISNDFSGKEHSSKGYVMALVPILSSWESEKIRSYTSNVVFKEAMFHGLENSLATMSRLGALSEIENVEYNGTSTMQKIELGAFPTTSSTVIARYENGKGIYEILLKGDDLESGYELVKLSMYIELNGGSRALVFRL